MADLLRRESLRTRARKKARNIGKPNQRRREAAGQSVFGALLELMGQSPREMEEKYGIPKTVTYRYLKGLWNKPAPPTRDRVFNWFIKETRRTLDLIALQCLVTTKAAADPMERRAQVRRHVERQPEIPQDRPRVEEIQP